MKKSIPALPLLWRAEKYEKRWISVFEYRINASDGLSPGVYKEVIEEMMKLINKIAPRASLWVRVESQGNWYINALKCLLADGDLPVVVTRKDERWNIRGYVSGPWQHRHKPLRPAYEIAVVDNKIGGKKDKTKLRLLKMLTRLGQARAREITSAAGISHSHTRSMLPVMVEQGLIRKDIMDNHPVYLVTDAGKKKAYRSLKIPEGIKVKSIEQELNYYGNKHQRIVRKWGARLTEEYKYLIKIWGWWSNPYDRKGYPDAVACGLCNGRDVEIWLDVEDGKRGTYDLAHKYQGRWLQIVDHIRSNDVHLVYMLLAPPWVLDRVRYFLGTIPYRVAVVFEDWGGHNRFAFCKFGEFESKTIFANLKFHGRRKKPSRNWEENPIGKH